MSHVIKDGTGTGKLAKVDEDNNLHVFVHQSNIQTISDDQEKAFQVYMKRNFVAGATNEFVGYFEYNGSGKAHIDQLTFSTDSGTCKIEVYLDPTSVSGGSAANVHNLNRDSQTETDCILKHGLTTITATTDSTKEILDVRLTSGGLPTFTYEFKGALVLKKGDSFIILASVENASEKVRANILWFEEDQ